MTDEEVIAEIQKDSALNKARQVFRFRSARIEQAQLQRKPISPVAVRRMEFEAVQEIWAIIKDTL